MTRRVFSAERFREIRESRSLSQAELAQMAGVGVATVSKIEQGVRIDPQIRTLLKIADVLDVDLDAFVVSRRGKAAV